jgi:subtilase family serine protease
MTKIPLLAITTLTIALAGAPASTAGAASARPQWASTATRAYPLRAATRLGDAAPSTPLRLVVGLRMRDRAGIVSAIRSGHVMSTAQFVAAHAPTTAQVHTVETYLSRHGFRNVAPASNRLMITATATVAQASSAFDTHIARFRQNGHVVLANTRAARVPAALGGTVLAVLGLNTASRMSGRPRVAKNPPSSCAVEGTGYPCTYNPAGFWKAYDATGASTGASTSIAIFANGALGGVVKDLRTMETANGLAKVPVTIVRTGPASSDTSGADEWAMDTQYSTGMAQRVKRLYLYDAPSLDDADVSVEFNKFAAQNLARAASASFGECEFAASLGGSMAVDDNSFMQAAAQGQTVFTSSGDTGGFCPVGAGVNGVPAGAPDVSFPASSPWVVSVGGTTLVTGSDGSYSNEIAWLAGGGGPSYFESASAAQAGVVPPINTVCDTAGQPCGRGVPDIAMDADPNSGANVYVGGQPEGIGGTSLSSPLALGVWARLQTAHHNGLGFASDALYAAGGTAAFHDIVAGDVGPYPATPGWDYATGLGTFDVRAAIGKVS